MQHVAYIAMGSNQGDRFDNLRRAIKLLENHPSIQILRVSHFYETEPLTLNNEKQNMYLNGVIKVKCQINAVRLFNVLEEIETELGRIRIHKWSPRTIDLDLLFFDDEIRRSKSLTLPHPEIPNRRFVLEPLAEIAPRLVHPIKGRTIRTLLRHLKDNKKVKPLYRFQLRHSFEGILSSKKRQIEN